MPGNILSFINNVSIREEIQKIFNCSNKILKYEKVQYLFVCLVMVVKLPLGNSIIKRF